MKTLITYIAFRTYKASVCACLTGRQVLTNTIQYTFVKTRTWACVYTIIIATSACGQDRQEISVEHHGVLREIMMEQKLAANASLSDYKDKPNFYALGALEGLSGEVLIIDSKPMHGKVSNGVLSIERSFDPKATLLVSSTVKDWEAHQVNLNVQSLQELQSVLAQTIIDAGLDSSKPFPFLLQGEFDEVKWHVINAADATEQSHDAYKKAGLSGVSNEASGQILGFYSEKHEGIFTHHGSFLHMHFVNKPETEVGHVDDLQVNGAIQLLIPKMK